MHPSFFVMKVRDFDMNVGTLDLGPKLVLFSLLCFIGIVKSFISDPWLFCCFALSPFSSFLSFVLMCMFITENWEGVKMWILVLWAFLWLVKGEATHLWQSPLLRSFSDSNFSLIIFPSDLPLLRLTKIFIINRIILNNYPNW